jgi:uncharacterized membrane protein YeaQ/YmgE (transglycosylase-associated protein family)
MVVVLVIVAVILLLVFGVALIGLTLKLLWWALIGLVIGALARLVLPGTQRIGLLGTAAAGLGGALLGGILAHTADVGGLLQFLIAIGLAALLIAALEGIHETTG